MQAYELDQLVTDQQGSGRAYLEFLRVASMSLGIYHLPAGSVDPQKPHTEDEVYYVAQGRAMVQVGGEDRAVQPGSIVYVAKGVDHRFHTITEGLVLVVFFAPAEYSGAGS